MAHIGVWADSSKPLRALRSIEDIPGSSEQDVPTSDEDIAQDVQRVEVRVTLPSQEYCWEVSVVVREQVNARVAAAEPSREQVDRQRETIHLGEERYQKGGERPERLPVALGVRPGKAESEDDEHRRVDDDERPEAIGGRIHRSLPPSGCCSCSASWPEWPPCPWCMNRCNSGHR